MPQRQPSPAEKAAAAAALAAPPATSAAAGAVGTAAGVEGAKELEEAALRAILTVLKRLGRFRTEALIEEAGKKGIDRDDLTAALEVERERERNFQRLAVVRVKAGLRVALRAPDPSARAAGVEAIVRRERRFARQRAQAQAERVFAAVERISVKRVSPSGAFWTLGQASYHTPDCLAMAGRFWPWSVVDRIHPPLHVGCVCGLITLGEAISSGRLTPDAIPSSGEAHRIADPIIQHVKDEEEEAEKAVLAEMILRMGLTEVPGVDLNALAALPLQESRRIWVDPHVRAGSSVSGYWKLVDALHRVANPGTPEREMELPDGDRVIHSRGSREFILFPARKKWRRKPGPVRLRTAHDVAEHVGATTAGATPVKTARNHLREDMARRYSARAALAAAEFVREGEPFRDTRHFYGKVWETEDGRQRWAFTDPERIADHRRAAHAMMAGVAPPKRRKPYATFTAGGPGSGKGFLKESGRSDLIGKDGTYADVDPDEWKRMAPERRLLVERGYERQAASHVHEQSSAVAKAAAREALGNGLDVVVDGVGGSDGWFSRLDRVIEDGTHDVAVTFTTVPIDVAVERAEERGRLEGRYVDPDAMREGHIRALRGWDRIAALPVPVELWDMEEGPNLIAKVDENGNVTVIDPDAYGRFQRRVSGAKIDREGGNPVTSDAVS